ncbi:MAG: cyclase [Caedibacter sp. 38-128]|nr:cyclase family protein [Holosporales bacterium]OJX08589.1 MAG: cyclase [Caedibacter sp. 38-128]
MFDNFKLVDLTHSLHSKIPTWEGGCGFEHVITHDYPDGPIPYRAQQIRMRAGGGTHMDAPAHFFPQALSIDQIPLESLFVPAVVLDVTQQAHEKYAISPKDIQAFEKIYGKIPPQSLVIGYTGWDQFWHSPEKYKNLKPDGRFYFPCFSEEAAEILLERACTGLAIDTLSPDGSNYDFPVHKLMLGAGKFLIENIANSKKMPPIGAYVVALPLKMENLTESAIRVVGIIPKPKQ